MPAHQLRPRVPSRNDSSWSPADKGWSRPRGRGPWPASGNTRAPRDRPHVPFPWHARRNYDPHRKCDGPGTGVSLPQWVPSASVVFRHSSCLDRSQTSHEARAKIFPTLKLRSRACKSSRWAAGESGYFLVRTALARSVTEAAKYIAERGGIEEGAPVLVRFLTQVAARFGL